jgi:hypothetical protein
MMHDGFFGFGWLWLLVWGAIVLVPFWRICERAGYPGPLSLLILVPLVNIGFLYFLGFSRWPGSGNEP